MHAAAGNVTVHPEPHPVPHKCGVCRAVVCGMMLVAAACLVLASSHACPTALSVHADPPSDAASNTWPPARRSLRVLPPNVGYRLPPVPRAVTSAIIEVGTGAAPHYVRFALGRRDAFFLGVEPIKFFEAATYACGILRRCFIVPAAVSNVGTVASMSEGVLSECSSLLSHGVACARSVARRNVTLLTLDEVVALLPPRVDVEVVALDCQGMDFYAASSLRTQRHRVANLVVECQDLPHGHAMLLHKDARIRNCGDILACVTQHWGWVHTECDINNDESTEYNCHFYNPAHPLQDRSGRFLVASSRRAMIRVRAPSCAVADFNETDRGDD